MSEFKIFINSGVKYFILVFLSVMLSSAAFAQFPLKATKDVIKDYFDRHVSYMNQQEFKTPKGCIMPRLMRLGTTHFISIKWVNVIVMLKLLIKRKLIK
jgi:hypothetical protein